MFIFTYLKMQISLLCAMLIAVHGLGYRATTSDSPIDATIRNNAHVVGHEGAAFIVCGEYYQLTTPAIFRTRPSRCQIVTYGCACINSRAYSSNATSWSISPLFNECFVTRIPAVTTTMEFVWISSVSKLKGTLCDTTELTYMYTDEAEGTLTVTLTPLASH